MSYRPLARIQVPKERNASLQAAARAKPLKLAYNLMAAMPCQRAARVASLVISLLMLT